DQFGGTSSATPLTAGTAGLLFARAADLGLSLTASDIKGLLRNTTDLVGPASITYDAITGSSTEFASGRLNARRAVAGVGVAELGLFQGRTGLVSGSVQNLGSVRVGQSSTQTFRIRNEGTSPLSLSGLSLSGSGDFTLSSGLGSGQLAVGESTTFAVTFTPTQGGTRQATVSFNSSDTDEATVSVDLVGEGRVVAITGRVFEDWNGNAATEAYDPAVAGRMVYLDQNNNGSFDDTRQVLTLNSGTLNLAIPDGTGASVSSSLTVAGAIGTAEDVEVTLNITHTWVSDLQIVLQGPNGTSIPLITSRGGSGDNLTGTIFDDQAATAISAGSAPFTGRFRPESPLSVFNGLNANGQWTLVLTDSVSVDAGTLLNWSLRVVSSDASTFIEPNTTTDATGVYLFENLPAGTQVVRAAPATGWITAPALVIDRPSAETIVTGAHFPLTRPNAIYSRVYSDTNANGAADTGEPGVAGTSLFFDQNANGRFDPIQSTTTVASATLNLAIPDNNLTGVNSTLSVAGVSGPLTDLDVTMTLSHLNVGDLIITLTSPTGTTLTLFNRRGSTGDNLTNTTFDDSAIVAISGGLAPFTGRYRPESPLSGFNGGSPNGTWTLNVSDRATGTSGTLVRWSMRVRTGELAQTTDSAGLARFDNVIAGSYTVAQAIPAGVRQTVPAGGTTAVTLTAGASAHALHFGNEIIAASSITGRMFEDWNGNATRETYDPGLSSRQVFLDSNTNGTYDGPVNNPLDSGTISLAIPDNSTTGVSHSLVVSGLVGTISDIDLTLDVTHTNIGDLVVQLRGPNNFLATLVDRRGGTGDHFTGTIFDDQATSDIADGTAPFTARYRPEVPLSNFNGLNPNGTWTITVSDRSALTTGTLVRWRMTMQTQSAATEPIATTDTSGNYTFSALPAGTQVVRANPTTGWTSLNSRTVELPTASTAVTGADLAQTRQNSIYTRVFNDQDANGSPGLTETGLASRSIFLDANGNGIFDGQQVFSSGNVNLAIPDNSTTGVNSFLAVAGTTANISDLDVTVNLNHTWMGDVVLTLRSPTGTLITLINQRGSSGDNMVNTVFDDQASLGISSGSAPFTGRFRPENALSAFNGQSANGNWTLNASDRFSTDIGTLLNWSLTFTLGVAEPSAITDSNGLARFDSVAAGTHNVRQVQTVGWRFTSPPAGVTTATLSTGAAAFPPQFGNLVDAIAPTPVSIVRNQAAITNAGTVAWTVNLSETVTGLSLANFSLTQSGVSGAALTSLTGSGSTYTVTATTGSGDGTLTLNLANGTGVVDLALNPLTGTPFAGQSYTLDRTSPQVAAFRVLYGAGRSFDVLSSSRSILPWQITGIEVVFSEAIGTATAASLTGVTTTGISGVGTSTVGWSLSTVTQGNLNTLLKASGTGAILDIAGNPLAGGTDYARLLRILFADFTGDGMVNSADLSGVFNRTVGPYDLFADVDGSGVVNSLDVSAVRRRIGARL
ncbi:MAG: beta strand repeat-containing protein, partial [Planctomycetaceae bacterium]